MYQTPLPIWNEIAKTQELATPQWRRLLNLDPEAMPSAIKDLETRLEQKGADPRSIRAYLLTAPLLAENEAISRYVEASGNPGLRASLPELTSINEALVLASHEFRLSPSQQSMLRKLLLADYETATSGAPSA